MSEVMSVDTFGGRVQVEWNIDSCATSIDQLAFFAMRSRHYETSAN